MSEKIHPFTVKEESTVYLRRPFKVIRKTRGGLWLCQIGQSEVSIPEWLLQTESAKEWMDDRCEKAIVDQFKAKRLRGEI